MLPTNNFRNISLGESNLEANLKPPRDGINHASGMDEQGATKKNKKDCSEKESLELKVIECADSTFNANGQMDVEANLANREVKMLNMDSKAEMGIGLEESFSDAVYHGNWVLAQQMLEQNPKVHIDVTPLEGPGAGITLLWCAANWQQWELVNKMLELNPKANLDAAPLEGFNAGKTPLWWAVGYQQWELVKKMLELNPKANLDAASLEGPQAGTTPLWWAALGQQWELVNKMLELNPKANLDAAALEGPNAGKTPLWLAAGYQQWELVNKMLELNPKANLNAAPLEGPDAGVTPLWLAAFNRQWDLVNKMLELNPKANLDAAALKGPEAGKKLLDIIFESKAVINLELSKLMAYLIVLGVDDTKFVKRDHGMISIEWKRVKDSIDLTFSRVAITFYDMWHNAEGNIFRKLLPELFAKPCLYVIWSEQPELKSISETVLLAKLTAHVDLMYEANQAKACKNIAILAFNAFRWENGLWDQTYTKLQINDLYRLIESCLLEFQKNHKDIQYHQKNRERIVNEIGKKQEEYPVKLTKSGIKLALERALCSK